MFIPVLAEFIYMFCGRKTVAFKELLESDESSLLIVDFNYYKNVISYLSIIILTTAGFYNITAYHHTFMNIMVPL